MLEGWKRWEGAEWGRWWWKGAYVVDEAGGLLRVCDCGGEKAKTKVSRFQTIVTPSQSEHFK